jgi:hypothetical protein
MLIDLLGMWIVLEQFFRESHAPLPVECRTLPCAAHSAGCARQSYRHSAKR